MWLFGNWFWNACLSLTNFCLIWLESFECNYVYIMPQEVFNLLLEMFITYLDQVYHISYNVLRNVWILLLNSKFICPQMKIILIKIKWDFHDITCTHIRTRSPSVDGNLYMNRKYPFHLYTTCVWCRTEVFQHNCQMDWYM